MNGLFNAKCYENIKWGIFPQPLGKNTPFIFRPSGKFTTIFKLNENKGKINAGYN